MEPSSDKNYFRESFEYTHEFNLVALQAIGVAEWVFLFSQHIDLMKYETHRYIQSNELIRRCLLGIDVDVSKELLLWKNLTLFVLCNIIIDCRYNRIAISLQE